MGPQEPCERDESSLPTAFSPTAAEHYDRPGPLPAGLAELAAELDAVVARYGPLGAPLWPAVASSAYAALLSGEEPARSRREAASGRARPSRRGTRPM